MFESSGADLDESAAYAISTAPEDRARAAYALGATMEQLSTALDLPVSRVRQIVRDLVRPRKLLRMIRTPATSAPCPASTRAPAATPTEGSASVAGLPRWRA